MTVVSFWCVACKKDFDSPAERFVFRGKDEYWRAKCPKGHKAVRFISNRKADPYYRESEKMRHEAHRYAKDLLQPGDPGFDTLYPEVRKEFFAKAEEREREIWEEARMQNAADGRGSAVIWSDKNIRSGLSRAAEVKATIRAREKGMSLRQQLVAEARRAIAEKKA